MLIMGAMGEVETGNIHTGFDQLSDHLRGAGGRTECTHNFRTTRHGISLGNSIGSADTAPVIR
jgi:hypothetical protein